MIVIFFLQVLTIASSYIISDKLIQRGFIILFLCVIFDKLIFKIIDGILVNLSVAAQYDTVNPNNKNII